MAEHLVDVRKFCQMRLIEPVRQLVVALLKHSYAAGRALLHLHIDEHDALCMQCQCRCRHVSSLKSKSSAAAYGLWYHWTSTTASPLENITPSFVYAFGVS